MSLGHDFSGPSPVQVIVDAEGMILMRAIMGEKQITFTMSPQLAEKLVINLLDAVLLSRKSTEVV